MTLFPSALPSEVDEQDNCDQRQPDEGRDLSTDRERVCHRRFTPQRRVDHCHVERFTALIVRSTIVAHRSRGLIPDDYYGLPWREELDA